MTTILITSPESNAGKTTAAIVIGHWLRRRGIGFDYLRIDGPNAEADVAFVRDVLPDDERSSRQTVGRDALAALRTRPDRARIIEANATTSLGSPTVLDDVRVIVVARFTPKNLTDQVLDAGRGLDGHIAGAIINAIPEKGLRAVGRGVATALQAAGVPLLAAIPQERSLIGTTAGELAQALEATVLCAKSALDRPVEAVMIAAMSDEGAEGYFRRRDRKVVIAAGDRPDVHMPALATDTSCIILTEGHTPDPTVLLTAEEQDVPLLMVSGSTVETLDRVSDLLRRVRFHQRQKLQRTLQTWERAVDPEAILSSLGVLAPASETR